MRLGLRTLFVNKKPGSLLINLSPSKSVNNPSFFAWRESSHGSPVPWEKLTIHAQIRPPDLADKRETIRGVW